MTALPHAGRTWLADHIAGERSVAHVRLGHDLRVQDWSGPIDRYALPALHVGARIVEQCDWLADVLPLTGDSVDLPNLSADGEHHFDAHIIGDHDGVWIFLLDATERVRRQQNAQQVAHELALLQEQGARAADMARAQRWDHAPLLAPEAAVILHERGAYRMHEPVPRWFSSAFPRQLDPASDGRSEFLAHFMVDAEAFWASGTPGELRSGDWVEVTHTGEECSCQAVAIRLVDGSEALFVRPADDDVRRQILQTAREAALRARRLAKEAERKEALLHCIVHDLAGPLASIQSALEMLARPGLPEPTARRMLDIGQHQASVLDGRIRQVLAVFRAELAALEAFYVDPARAPDVAACLRSVCDGMDAAFSAREVALVVHPVEPGDWRAVGHSDRLERVLTNLLENALRHAPRGSSVDVTLTSSKAGIAIAIDDRGPGIPADIQSRLFQQFVQGPAGGRSGLGLYFCSITLGPWGGSIAHEPREGGGTRFIVTLRRVDPP